ncbi:unnamed protein product [Medioppia subpectinata]|uniref:Heparan-sulfate 6-O-sulfotransferase n=1 Tax=Medioppia subpectinata TaxID=1979941 RepID=A0A7R9Q0B8_9ACAR|nr:unnamed protein product [Medioppia subpectinata]CAG2107900.1 unnamed protein product [Medioppia subpectinata]
MDSVVKKFGLLSMKWTSRALPLTNKSFVVIVLILVFMSFLLMAYLCPEGICPQSLRSIPDHHFDGRSLDTAFKDNLGKPLSQSSHPLYHYKLSFDDMINVNEFVFDIKGNDVIVFLHIQKTGGTTFGRHLVRDLDLEKPCLCKKGRKKCKCIRPDSEAKLWLFSRYSTGWKCGLHADFTELMGCVDNALDESERQRTKRRYFYITLLREPISRFLSEYRHVQRGATWKTSRHMCGGRVPTKDELPSCYAGTDWRDVTIEEFISCEHNLAINRQTRMLADLTLVDCYNKSFMSAKERDVILLASAKENLRRMAFFGLCEHQKISQYLFEMSFHLNFLQPFVQLNETHSTLTYSHLKPDLVNKIKRLNHLDIELYEFAKQLLMLSKFFYFLRLVLKPKLMLLNPQSVV